jgi:hypothetical protein
VTKDAIEAITQNPLYLQIRADAETAAGPLSSLRMRARGYLDLYHASHGVCRFALVAAHGALWASWYLICAKFAACVFAVVDPTTKLSRPERYRQFAAYVLLLKEINHLVMVETYVLVHTIQKLGVDAAIAAGIPDDIARDYATAMQEKSVKPDMARDLYLRHFLWEQERVVSTKLDDGFAVFTWPLMRNMCQRPWVWFAYFGTGKSLNFRNFTDQVERVEKGMISYDRGVSYGLDRLAKTTHIRLRILPGVAHWRLSWAKSD